jgi:hypothetical protein
MVWLLLVEEAASRSGVPTAVGASSIILGSNSGVNDLDFKSEAINAVEANMMGKRKEDKEEKKKLGSRLYYVFKGRAVASRV